jgi:hypothetical protein
MFGPNTQNFKSMMAGFSLPGLHDYWTGCMLEPARRGTCQVDLGIFLARCTDNTGNTLPNWFVNGYNLDAPTPSKSPETFFNFLRP